jgi:hypothetical protein
MWKQLNTCINHHQDIKATFKILRELFLLLLAALCFIAFSAVMVK